MKCANCGAEHTDIADVCILAVLGGILVDRGWKLPDVLAAMGAAGGEIDVMWDYIAPAIDCLEAYLPEGAENPETGEEAVGRPSQVEP